MSYEPTEIQRLILWRLIASGGEDWQKEIKPELKKNSREAMVRAGFLEVERKRDPKTKGTGNYVHVADAGWAWAKTNMNAKLPTRSTAGADVLRRFLERLSVFLEGRDIDLTDVIRPRDNELSRTDSRSSETELSAQRSAEEARRSEVPSPSEPMAQSAVNSVSEESATEAPDHAAGGHQLADRVADACMKLSRGQANARVRLSDLRRRLADVDRHDLDQVLLHMSRDRKLSLYRLDNPREVGPEDEAAAVHTASGEPRHIVYFG